MKTLLYFTIYTLFIFNSVIFSQDAPANTICGTHDSIIVFDGPIGVADMSVAFVFLDFPDGRLANGQIPVTDTELEQVSNLDAVLNMGFISDNGRNFNKKVRKYTYDDFWNMYFSEDTYMGTAHPDWNSHGRFDFPLDGDTARAFGSFKEYFTEVSYGKLTISPAVTHQNETGMYRTGIVNNFTDVSGKKYILPIKLSHNKTYYGLPNSNYSIEAQGFYTILAEAKQLLIDMFLNNEIEFNITNHLNNNGRVIYVVAGGTYNTGGATGGFNEHEIALREKRSVNNDTNYTYKILNGLTLYCHEFGHALGFGHSGIGNYCVMTEGTSNQNCPSHFNIVNKLKAGWIDPQYINFVSSNQSVSNLPPSAYNGDCAVLTIYGKPGYSEPVNSLPDFTHSEFYVIENRRMLRNQPDLKFDKKFVWKNNRMPNPNIQGFNGGCLITHYSPYNNMGTYQGIKIENADIEIGVAVNDEGHSNHFFGVSVLAPLPFRSLTDNDEGFDRTKSSYELKTGIRITNIIDHGDGNINFSLNYSLGEPPVYDRVFYGQIITEPLNLSGLYFVHQSPIASNVTINPGAAFECRTSAEFGANILNGSGNLYAVGTELNPIIFRGIGYSTFVTQGGGLRFYSSNNSNTETVQIQHIRFTLNDTNSTIININNSNGSKSINIENIYCSGSGRVNILQENMNNTVNAENITFENYFHTFFGLNNTLGAITLNNFYSGDKGHITYNLSNSSSSLNFQNINFGNNDSRLYLISMGSTRSQLQTIDNCNFTLYNIFGYWNINMNNDFIIPQGSTLLLDNKADVIQLNDIEFTTPQKFHISGNVDITGSVNLNRDIFIDETGKCKIRPFDNGPISQNYIKFTPNSGILCNGSFDANGLTDSVYLTINGSGKWNGIKCLNNLEFKMNNVKVRNALSGIEMSKPESDVFIENSRFSDNQNYDIYLDNLHADFRATRLIKNNIFTGNPYKQSSILCNNGLDIRVENNQFDEDYSLGISLLWLTNPVIKQNLFKAATTAGYSPNGIYSYSSGGFISCNDITNYSKGIYLSNSSPFIYNNDIYNNGVGLFCE